MDLAKPSAASSITIRPLQDVAAYEHFQQLERRVWGSDAVDIMPVHVLATLAKNGGLVLGAYDADGPESTGGLVGAT